MENQIFINIALEIAKFSKCQSKQVGCVIVRDRRIISSGCNGSPSGAMNCNEIFKHELMNDPKYRECHHKFSESMECHAEENAIIMAARYGNAIENCKFYVYMKPCERCLKMIAGLGVKEIYYCHDYDKFIEYSPHVQRMIKDLGIKITKIESNSQNDFVPLIHQNQSSIFYDII